MHKAALCEEEAFVTGVLMGIVSYESSATKSVAKDTLLSTLCRLHRISFHESCASANAAMRAVRP